MSIHHGDEVWAGASMQRHELGHGSGATVDDEGAYINWGFWLGSELNALAARSMVSKLIEELGTHSKVEDGVIERCDDARAELFHQAHERTDLIGPGRVYRGEGYIVIIKDQS